MKYKLEQKSQEELSTAIVTLLAFLDEHKDMFSFVDYQGGILVSISPVKLIKDTGLVVPEKKEFIK